MMQARTFQSTRAARPAATRARCVITRAQNVKKVQDVKMSPLLLAASWVLGTALMGAQIVDPPAAFADDAADKRAAIIAKRKALLAESRAKAEASLDAKKDTSAADDAVDRANAERARLAALRAAEIDKARATEYEKAAANAIKEAPPV